MSESNVGVGMLLARIGAVVLALGAVSYFVWNAQVNAQPDDDTPSAETPAETPSEDVDDHFIRSSKSFVPSDLTDDEDTFLPSTKGAIGLGGSGGPFGSRGQAQEQPKPEVKEEDTFLPSSKSLPVGKSVPKKGQKSP